MSSAEPTAHPHVQINPEDLDDNGFTSLWNIASSTCAGDIEQSRSLASSLLNFLCHKKCDFVVTSTTDAEYLDAWFERDTSLLYNWKADSERVDVMTQHAEVPFNALVQFLENYGYSPDSNYNPKRANRVEWFTNQWSVG